MVIIEKNPNASAAIAEKARASTFLNLICRMTETTDKIATIKKITPSTTISTPLFSFKLNH